MRSCLESNETIKRVLGAKGDRGRFYKVRTPASLAHNPITTQRTGDTQSGVLGVYHTATTPLQACRIPHAQISSHCMGGLYQPPPVP